MKEEKFEYTIEKGKKGFCVWVKEGKVKHWIIDGSTILKDNTFRIGKNDKVWRIVAKKLKTPRWEKYEEYEVRKR
jgi:hypothetical protein